MAAATTELPCKPREELVNRLTSYPGVAWIPFNYGKVLAGDARHASFVLQPGHIAVIP